ARPQFSNHGLPLQGGWGGGEARELGVSPPRKGGGGGGGGGTHESCCMPPSLSLPRKRGRERTESAALSKRSPAVEQEAVVLELHARDLARAHGAQEMRERDGGVGVGEALGADVGDAVALRVGRLRRRLAGEIGAPALR